MTIMIIPRTTSIDSTRGCATAGWGRFAVTFGVLATLIPTQPPLRLQRDQFAGEHVLPHLEGGDRHRQLEAPRTGAARVHVQDTIAAFDHRLVRMSGNHGGKTGAFRVDV